MSALEQGRTDAEGPPGAVDVNVYRTSAERAASGEAPLKKEFLKPVWVMPRKRNRDEKVLATSTTDPKATRTSEEAGDATVAGQSEAAPAGAPDNTSDVVMAEPEGTAAGGDAQVPTGALRGAEKPQKLSKGRYTKTARKKRAQELRESSFQESGLCPTVAREGPDSCRFGEKCRYSHDLAAYIAQRPPDLPITPCPQFAALGSCGSGVKCRCGSSHIKDGRNVVDEEKQAHAAENRAMNALPKDLQRQLRRREFPFKRSLEVVPKYNNGKRMSFVTKAQERRRMKNIRRAERKAAAAAAAGEEAPSVTSTADGDETPAEEAPQESKGQTDCAAASAMDVESTTAVPVAEASSPADVDVTKNSAADVIAKLRPAEKKKVDFVDKLVLAPLTTIGNLPFRRICKGFGADITIGEMAMATSLLQGQNMEWALLKRHPCEDVFGVQLAGGYCDTLAASCELINEHASVDFVDLNCGCPIDLVCYKGAGCSLPTHRNKFEGVCRSMAEVLDVPLTVKMRVGYSNGSPTAHKIFPDMASWGVSALTELHGRTREQRYTRESDWDYIGKCAGLTELPLIGNGDVYTWEDAVRAKELGVPSIMLARGAMIKPWLFDEIKQKKHIDISASERMVMLENFIRFGLEHWGSDDCGVENTRYFFLNWMSFLHRYVPVGLLETLDVKLTQRAVPYYARDDREQLLASDSPADWVRLSEMWLGPAPPSYADFVPKHKANAYQPPSVVVDA